MVYAWHIFFEGNRFCETCSHAIEQAYLYADDYPSVSLQYTYIYIYTHTHTHIYMSYANKSPWGAVRADE